MNVGSDESLKGDTFGGLVVAAVLVTAQQEEELLNMGVADSKTIPDTKIRILAPLIKKKVSGYAVESYLPEEYNKYTLTALMNDLHRFVAQKTISQFTMSNPGKHTFTHIVDKYPGCTVGDIIETQAESKYVAVAAASILARDAGLDQFDWMSKKLGFTVPKGSTHVALALERLKNSEHNPILFVKMNFKNVQLVFKRA